MALQGVVGPPWWDDGPVAIVASGNSLRDQGLGLRGAHVLAVKGAMFDLPFAEAGFGLDAPRYEEWTGRLAGLLFPCFWAVNPIIIPTMPVPPANVTLLGRREDAAISDDPSTIYAGGTSGFGALNLAVLKRAKRIFLFGYDYRQVGGEWHHNSQHFAKARDQDHARWSLWAGHFSKIAPELAARGIEVVNASPDSAITCFKRMSIEQAVADICGVRPS